LNSLPERPGPTKKNLHPKTACQRFLVCPRTGRLGDWEATPRRGRATGPEARAEPRRMRDNLTSFVVCRLSFVLGHWSSETWNDRPGRPKTPRRTPYQGRLNSLPEPSGADHEQGAPNELPARIDLHVLWKPNWECLWRANGRDENADCAGGCDPWGVHALVRLGRQWIPTVKREPVAVVRRAPPTESPPLVSSHPRRTKPSSSMSRSTKERRNPESCSSFRSIEEPHAGFATVVLGRLTWASLQVAPCRFFSRPGCGARRCVGRMALA